MADNFNTIEGTEIFNVNDAVQGSHAVSINNLKDFNNSNIFYDNYITNSVTLQVNPTTGNDNLQQKNMKKILIYR